jgi:hypothetical protein
MKIQAQNNELRPLVRHSYEKVYDQLAKLLSADEFIFAKWEAGFGNVLQWSLPADHQWRCLTQADSFDHNAVSAEFLKQYQSAAPKLGSNHELVKNIFSVPAESYVYYTIEPDGRYRVMLTAWGYAFPQKPACDSTLIARGKPGSQAATLRFIDCNLPAAGLQFNILRDDAAPLHRLADNDGQYQLGAFNPGENIQIEIPSVGKTQTITIINGKAFYTIDITQAQPIIIPEPDKPTEPVVDPVDHQEEPEPIDDSRRQDISIRFINPDGSPIATADDGSQVELSDSSTILTETLDDQGAIYLDKRDFAPDAKLSLNLLNTPITYAPISLQLEPDETQYEIVITLKQRSNLWEIIGVIAGAIIVAGLAFFGFALIHDALLI